VLRGLRMEFCRPSWPGSPRTRASGRPITLDSGRAMAGARVAAPRKNADRARADQLDGRLGQPDGQQGHAQQAEHPAAMNRRCSEAAGGPGPPVIQRGEPARCAPRRGPALWRRPRLMPTSDQEPDQGGARLEDQRAGRQGDPEPAQAGPAARARPAPPRPSPMTEETSP